MGFGSGLEADARGDVAHRIGIDGHDVGTAAAAAAAPRQLHHVVACERGERGAALGLKGRDVLPHVLDHEVALEDLLGV